MANSDKYIISEFYDFTVDRNLIIEAEQSHKPIKLKGILQKANTQNRNGRVYPYDILKREADKYMISVKERRALGECVPAGTQIFTENGWKNIEDVEEGDSVFTLNLITNESEIQYVQNTIDKVYNDDLIHIYNDLDLDFITTKKHKVIVWNELDEYFILTAEELHEKILNKEIDLENLHIKTSEFINIEGENSLEEEMFYFHYDESVIQNFEQKNKIYLKTKSLKSEKIPFNDKVYCVSVPNKTWLMKYNNKISWTHNCDHPDSPIVSLSNSSHLVTNMWWESDTLMGEVELVETEAGNKLKGLLKSGVMLGISSRGVGSVKNVRGKDVVQDDFELIAFDFVSTPSTPGAYMFKEGKSWGMTKIIDASYKNSSYNQEKYNNFNSKIIDLSKDNYWNL
jgi:hypothetical protein